MKLNFATLIKFVIFLLVIGVASGISLALSTAQSQTKLIRQADKLLEQKKYLAAAQAYSDLLQSNPPESHLLWINQGYAWFGLREYDKMLQSCDQATSIEPQVALGWGCRGEASYYLERYRDARRYFDQAIALYPENATFWLNQSQVLMALQQPKLAIQANNQVIRILTEAKSAPNRQRDLAIAHEQQGQNWLELQQNQQALAAFDLALEHDDQLFSARQGRAIALYRLGQYSEAAKAFSKILQRQDDLFPPQEALNWLYKGISLCQADQVKDANKAFAKVLEMTEIAYMQQMAQAGCGIR